MRAVKMSRRPADHSSDHPRVLLVDDSDVILERATATLSRECQVVGAVVPIVFLTIHDDEQLVLATQAVSGIADVVKTSLPSDLVVAVNEACAGRRYVSQMR